MLYMQFFYKKNAAAVKTKLRAIPPARLLAEFLKYDAKSKKLRKC